MIPTIEVEIDKNGQVHLIDPVDVIPVGRAFLTFISQKDPQLLKKSKQAGQAEDILALLKTKRYENRPKSSITDIESRIINLRNDWGIIN